MVSKLQIATLAIVKTLFIPGIIGASVAQISVFSDKIIANFIGPRSSLYYAERNFFR